MNSLELPVADEPAMVELGRALAAGLVPGSAVHLRGDLGAGKTTLARGVAQGLGHEGAVKSPTYTLVEPYLELAIPLYHFDLYRLGNAEELEYLGLRDYLDGQAIILVEWPQRGGDFLPGPDLEISIALDGAGRRVRIDALRERGQVALDALRDSPAMRQAGGDDDWAKTGRAS